MSGNARVDTWRISLRVPEAHLAHFEAALGRLGGALTLGLADGEGLVSLSLYLAARPAEREVLARLGAAALASACPLPPFTVEALPDRDWVAESEKALPPIRAGRFFVHGSHLRASPPPGAIAIEIDASLAFGTGRHETTRGCLLALTALAKRRAFRRPLDLGCGSGILAIAMAKLWPVAVTAADNDRTALRIAGGNARGNGVGPRIRLLRSDGYDSAALRTSGPFDLIAANILARPLCQMARDLRRNLAPGGVAVLSGLLTGQEAAVCSRHRAGGLVVRARLRLDEWSTLLLAG